MRAIRQGFQKALAHVLQHNEPTRENLAALINANEPESKVLYQLADRVRSETMGDEVHLRGVIEFSNYCIRDCLYCGLRRSNSALPRYRMSPKEILESVRMAEALGCKTIVLQSGEDICYNPETISGIIEMIKERHNLVLTLSIGDRSLEEYTLFRKAGADRYLLKHEICDSRVFSVLRPGTTLAQRIQRLKWLRMLGYQVGSGNMVGLPGQDADILAKDILLLKKIGVEMAGIGPFLPNRQTPLGNSPGGPISLALKVLAISRIVLPDVHLPATTAIGTIHPEGRLLALKYGANVIMPNMTPRKYRLNYSIYPEKSGMKDTPEESMSKALNLIKRAGRTPGNDAGDSLRHRMTMGL